MNHLIFSFLFLAHCFAAADPLAFSLSTEYQNFYLNPKNSSNSMAKYEFRVKGNFDLLESLSLKTNITANYLQHFPKQDQKKFLVNPTDFGFFGGTEYLDYTFGFWTLVPEGTDINNIFDVIHGRDYRQPFSSENLGSLGVILNPHVGSFDLKLFYIPKNNKSVLPDTQSPWFPRTETLPLTNGTTTILIPDSISYVYRDEQELEKPFDNNYGSVAKLSFDWIDLYGFYFSGAGQIPQIRAHFNADAISAVPGAEVVVIRPPVLIDRIWAKSEHIGGGLSTVLDPVIFKTFCKNQKDFYSTVQESTSCSATLEGGIPMGRMTLHTFLQVHRQWKKTSTAQELETLLGFFEKSTTLGFLAELNSENTLSGAVVYNEKSPSYLTSIRYEKRWTDRFKTNFAVNVISAQDEPLAKAYDQTDNATLRFNYDF